MGYNHFKSWDHPSSKERTLTTVITTQQERKYLLYTGVPGRSLNLHCYRNLDYDNFCRHPTHCPYWVGRAKCPQRCGSWWCGWHSWNLDGRSEPVSSNIDPEESSRTPLSLLSSWRKATERRTESTAKRRARRTKLTFTNDSINVILTRILFTGSVPETRLTIFRRPTSRFRWLVVLCRSGSRFTPKSPKQMAPDPNESLKRGRKTLLFDIEGVKEIDLIIVYQW